MTTKRPIHRGISEFALWALKESRGRAILAGCHVEVLDVRPDRTKGDGWYNVQVGGVDSTSVYWMDVTTAEYEQRARDEALLRKRHRAERRKRGVA